MIKYLKFCKALFSKWPLVYFRIPFNHSLISIHGLFVFYVCWFPEFSLANLWPSSGFSLAFFAELWEIGLKNAFY